MIQVRRVLHPTDFSSYCTPAYFHALALAEGHDAELIVAHVSRPGDDADYWRDQLEQIRPMSDRIRVRHVLLAGDPAEQIVAYAARCRADVVVMGTHGLAGCGRLMGGTAQRVLREAPCSVLVVKLPRGAGAESAAAPDLALSASD